MGLGEGNVWGMEEGVRATGAKHISARGRRGGGRERRSDPGTLPLPSVRMYCRVLKKKRMREEYVNGGRSVGRVMGALLDGRKEGREEKKLMWRRTIMIESRVLIASLPSDE